MYILCKCIVMDFYTTFIFLTSISIISMNQSLSSYKPVTFTRTGKIEGTYEEFENNLVEVYRGVPFAEPPVAKLRFKKPVPLKYNPRQRYEAFKSGPRCVQVEKNIPENHTVQEKNEDCLYLNIWVPITRLTRNYAVMFWVHSGTFTTGSNSEDIYDGKILAIKGDIIVVTTNYRLGPLGFAYANTPQIDGNVGLYDILEALKWTHANIHYFGGDNKKITLSGQSSSSMINGLFAVSKMTRHLFKRIIMQSGAPSPMVPVNPKYNYNRTLTIAKAVNCASPNDNSFNDNIIACLRKINATLLVVADKEISGNYAPQYIDKLFPTDPRHDIAIGNFKSAELLIGNVRDEGAFILPKYYAEDFGVFGEKIFRLNKTYGRKIIRQICRDIPHIEEIIDYYYGKVKDDDYDKIANQTYRIYGDLRYRCANEYFAQRMAEKNNVYFYYFLHRPSNSHWASWMGIVHNDDKPFFFGHPLRYSRLYKGGEIQLSEQMVKVFTSFIKTGKPEIPSGKWPFYSKQSKNYLTINTTVGCSIGYGPEVENCIFLQNLLGFV